ncbi:putative Holliday junction resolvase [Bathymodiolus platifrons methanotrophic gill symbiont]|uniref:Holliday junction resolvase RuvX n=1 Tax=Bathymodiolus platifrons methanotrophic gill symbiont TaxID=113268 RepID=UPI000B40965C|nr:Holliday junction resolvase RuvX [Bathymodiolus platifrons methanotrophic gill symbiont]MCK5869994.1 Holliday junction resolvase RuvX [Methyloprofundus sp.]TXK93924.1 Holliday junction resolvase RuvX [Methylococcaceae bacterium CS5]TXK94988.1 Holliday junction resolvase RuvX [Methylococcaceae bacterium HT1]TXK98990.1 Holliday junction resolvase RuvX [Methylococcaceae bacterium CS4]TXL03090.1 Holliday junction resolvase RuvX [Methylococcaceae bacterium CS1]TXL03375.1 Holliday junction resol
MHKQDPVLAKLNSDSYLGFDFGNKKIGMAVGQLTTKTASPLETIRSLNQVPNWEKISQIIKEWQPEGLVVGVSRQFDGTDNPITPRMLKFCRQLNGRFNLPVFQMDEALSTFEAKQMLYDDVHVSASKLWEVQDQLAAQLILQSWLNQQSNNDS